MKYHPIANVWPLMTEQEIEDLAEDIRRNGQLCPIWTYEGMILDGRNRWAACLLANVKPIVREYEGDQPTAFAVALNDKRRHMNKAALAAVAAELEPFFAEDAKNRQRQHGGTAPGKAKALKAKMPEVNSRQARDDAAQSVGVGSRYVSDAKKIKQEAPEVFEKLKTGKISMQDASTGNSLSPRLQVLCHRPQ